MHDGDIGLERMGQILEMILSGDAEPEEFEEEMEKLLPGAGFASIIIADKVGERYYRGEVSLEEAEEAIRSRADIDPVIPLLFAHCAMLATHRDDELEAAGYLALYRRKSRQFEGISDYGCLTMEKDEIKSAMAIMDRNEAAMTIWPYIDECGRHLVNHFLVQDIMECPSQIDEEEMDIILEREEEIVPLLVSALYNQVAVEEMELGLQPKELGFLIAVLGVLRPVEALPVLLWALEVFRGRLLHEAVLACAKMGAVYPVEISGALRETASDPEWGEVRLAAVEVLGLLWEEEDNLDFLLDLLGGLSPDDTLFDDMFIFLTHALLSSQQPVAGKAVASALEKHGQRLDDLTITIVRDYLDNYRDIMVGPCLEEIMGEDLWDLWPWGRESLATEGRRTMTLEREERLGERAEEGWDLDLQKVDELLRAGRNQPCFCGSGKKFKKCCLPTLRELRDVLVEEEQVDRGIQKATDTPFARLMQKLWAYSRTLPSVRSERVGAMAEFLGPLQREWFGREEIPEGDFLEMAMFEEWFLFNRPLSGSGGTVAEAFLSARGDSLGPEEKEYLRGLPEARFSVYEVLEVDPGRSLLLRDVFRGDEVKVREKTASRNLVKWDLLAVWVSRVGDHHEMLGTNLKVPRDYLEVLEDFVKRESRTLIRRKKAKDFDDFLRRWSFLVFHQVMELHAGQTMPTMITAEGDVFTPCEAVFDVEDPRRVRDLLSHHPYIEEDGEAGGAGLRRFTWFMSREMEDELRAGDHVGPQNEFRALDRSPKEAGEDLSEEGEKVVMRGFGTLELKGRRLILQTQSLQRLEAGKRALEEILPGLITHRADSIQDQEALLREAREGGMGVGAPFPGRSGEGSGIPPEVEKKIIEDMLEKVYADWLDTPIPYLDGKTPREAAETQEGRRRVDRLLKQYENQSERELSMGRPVFDFTRFREELDIWPDRE